jgi:hypothetical protein
MILAAPEEIIAPPVIQIAGVYTPAMISAGDVTSNAEVLSQF